MGDMWKGLVQWIRKYPMRSGYLTKKDADFLFVVKNADQAAEIIDEAYMHFKRGKKNFCLNYKLYKDGK